MLVKLQVKWSADKFSKFVKEFAEKANAETNVVLKKMAADLLSRIISRTPVDTGRARAGWTDAGKRLGVVVPQARTSEPDDSYYEEDLEGTTKKILIENRVPYVIYLEYGWSKQAPLGMVRISMAEMRSGGQLPAALAKSYKRLWSGLPGEERYTTQARIMAQGLPKVKNKITVRPPRSTNIRRPK